MAEGLIEGIRRAVLKNKKPEEVIQKEQSPCPTCTVEKIKIIYINKKLVFDRTDIPVFSMLQAMEIYHKLHKNDLYSTYLKDIGT